jgi:hypothetical protein
LPVFPFWCIFSEAESVKADIRTMWKAQEALWVLAQSTGGDFLELRESQINVLLFFLLLAYDSCAGGTL